MRNASQIRRLSGLGVALSVGLALASPALAAQLTPTEQANKQVVIDFYAALDKANADGNMKQVIPAIAEKYLDPNYTQHAETFKNLPGPGSDRDKLVRMFQSLPARPPGPAGAAPARPQMQRVETLMAEGDLVMFLRADTLTDPSTGKVTEGGIFNMFRVRDGKLVEHWAISSGMGGPPPAAGPGGPPQGAAAGVRPPGA